MNNHQGVGLRVASRLNCGLFFFYRKKQKCLVVLPIVLKYATQTQNVSTKYEHWSLRIKNVQNAQDRN